MSRAQGLGSRALELRVLKLSAWSRRARDVFVSLARCSYLLLGVRISLLGVRICLLGVRISSPVSLAVRSYAVLVSGFFISCPVFLLGVRISLLGVRIALLGVRISSFYLVSSLPVSPQSVTFLPPPPPPRTRAPSAAHVPSPVRATAVFTLWGFRHFSFLTFD
jgi:hypothetical protein